MTCCGTDLDDVGVQWPKHVVGKVQQSGRSVRYNTVAGRHGTSQWPKHMVGKVQHSGRSAWYFTVAGRHGTAQWPKHVVDINISNIIYVTVISHSHLEAFQTPFIDAHSSAPFEPLNFVPTPATFPKLHTKQNVYLCLCLSTEPFVLYTCTE